MTSSSDSILYHRKGATLRNMTYNPFSRLIVWPFTPDTIISRRWIQFPCRHGRFEGRPLCSLSTPPQRHINRNFSNVRIIIRKLRRRSRKLDNSRFPTISSGHKGSSRSSGGREGLSSSVWYRQFNVVCICKAGRYALLCSLLWWPCTRI